VSEASIHLGSFAHFSEVLVNGPDDVSVEREGRATACGIAARSKAGLTSTGGVPSRGGGVASYGWGCVAQTLL
jgi:hypothetical protein